jgi:hypothetical protein
MARHDESRYPRGMIGRQAQRDITGDITPETRHESRPLPRLA